MEEDLSCVLGVRMLFMYAAAFACVSKWVFFLFHVSDLDYDYGKFFLFGFIRKIW